MKCSSDLGVEYLPNGFVELLPILYDRKAREWRTFHWGQSADADIIHLDLEILQVKFTPVHPAQLLQQFPNRRCASPEFRMAIEIAMETLMIWPRCCYYLHSHLLASYHHFNVAVSNIKYCPIYPHRQSSCKIHAVHIVLSSCKVDYHFCVYSISMAQRKVADCRKMPSEKNCSVTIAGTEDEVVPLAVHHAVVDHGHADTPELRDQVRGMLVNE